MRFSIDQSILESMKKVVPRLKVFERGLMFVVSLIWDTREGVGLLKKLTGGSYCWVRLERALASSDWCSKFPIATVSHLTAVASDHGPILLRWKHNHYGRGRRGKKTILSTRHLGISQRLSWR
jgi:hypothetical protein